MIANNDLICPRCDLRLKQEPMTGGISWACGNCGGRAVTLDLPGPPFLVRWYRWIRVPAWSVLILWILFQAIGAFEQFGGFSSVSSFAHIGGAAVGFVG